MTINEDYQVVTRRGDWHESIHQTLDEVGNAYVAHHRNCDEMAAAYYNWRLTNNVQFLADAILRLNVGEPEAMQVIADLILGKTVNKKMSRDITDSKVWDALVMLKQNPEIRQEWIDHFNKRLPENAPKLKEDLTQDQLIWLAQVMLSEPAVDPKDKSYVFKAVESNVGASIEDDVENVVDAMKKRARARKARVDVNGTSDELVKAAKRRLKERSVVKRVKRSGTD
ncbi:MAG: hypothetical protein RL764_396 [Pseudomonadota bacterium]|jgi:hypothetical protein